MMKSNIENIHLEHIDYRELKPLQGDLKILTKENYAKLKKSFSEKNLFAPMFVWKNGNEYILLDGHGRRRLFEKERAIFIRDGKETYEVPCVIIEAKDLKDAKEKLLIITSQYQTMSQEGLDEFGFDLDDEWLKLTTVFDALTDFDALKEEQENQLGLTDENEIPEVPKNVKTKLGDLYILGEHRLLCGDSTKKEDVERLLSGIEPVLMVTDPPYGVNYEPEWRNEAAEKGKIAYSARALGKVGNDDRFDWTDAIRLFDGDVAYVWHAGIFAAQVAESLIKSDFEIRSQIIWAKQGLVISRGHYHWQHEPCWYAVKKGRTGHWSGDRKQTTLWQIANRNPRGGEVEDANTEHSTQKPVECMRRPIVNNSADGDAIYDPFLGSGTTLIAAQKTGRVCYGLELSPMYCDMIVERWEKFTGQKAEMVRG